MTYFVGKPKLLNKDLLFKRIQDILDSSIWTNNGQYVEAVENYLEDYLGAKFVVLVSNATIGLELALQYKKEVLQRCNDGPLSVSVPSFTFVATVLAAKRQGFEIKYTDIDDNYCMKPKFNGEDYGHVLLPVNLFGNIVDKSFYYQMPNQWSIFDNAHSLGVFNESKECYVGADCKLGVGSLHATKIAGAGECGYITTDDYDTYQWLLEARNFGYVPGSNGQLGLVEGTNAKVSEFQAAITLTQLECLQEIQEHYFNIHQEYERLLPDLIKPKNNMFSNYSYVVAEIENRDRIIEELNKFNIFPRVYFQPLHQTALHCGKDISLPDTERIAKRIMCLPTGLTISLEDVQYICGVINDVR